MSGHGDEFLGTVGEVMKGSAHLSIVDDTSESNDLEDSFGELDPDTNLKIKQREKSYDGTTTASSTGKKPGRTNSGNTSTSSRFRRTSQAGPAVISTSTSTSMDNSASLWPSRPDEVDQSLNLMDSSHYEIPASATGRRASGRMGMKTMRQKSLVDIFFDGEGENSRGRSSGDYGVDDLSENHPRKRRHICLFFLMAILVITFMVIMVPRFGAVSWDDKEKERDNNKPKETDAPEQLIEEEVELPPKKTPAPNENDTDESEEVVEGEATVQEQDRPLPEPEVPITAEDLSNIDPNESRLKAFEFYVVDQDVTDPEQLDLMGSPSKKALHWITQQDPAQLPIPGFDEDPTEDALNGLMQRYALAVFYFSQEESDSNNEAGNTRLRHKYRRELYEDATQEELENREAFDTNWLTAKPVCHWHGVNCGGADQVMEVVLSKHLFQGTIPREMLVGAAMPFLINLDLTHNRLAGELPRVTQERANAGQELGVAPAPSALMSLRLNYNKLTGPMNVLLGLPELKQLHLSHNQLTGPLSEWIEVDWKFMEELNLSHNKFKGKIPGESLGEMQALKMINLEGNTFTGELPTEIKTLANLERLDLSSNQLEGGIPEEYGDLTSLQLMDLEGNQLDGTVPTQLGKLSQLQHLQMDSNNLSGEMPQQVCGLVTEQALESLITDCTSGDIKCDCCTDCS